MRPADVHPDGWQATAPLHRALMVFYRIGFVPRWLRDVVWTWRVNRTPGPRHRYPWE